MKKYVIVESVAAPSIRWFMIDQNSFEECERSFLDDRFLISYSGTAPEFLDNISQKSQEYTKTNTRFRSTSSATLNASSII